MKGRDVLFSSARGDWRTPTEFFNVLDKEFKFKLDAAATPQNTLCKRHLVNAMEEPWTPGPVYCNPPYTEDMHDWMERAITWRSSTVVMLAPARTDTAWWQDAFSQASEVRFLRGRLKFDDSKHSAPFPSCVMIFRPGPVFGPRTCVWDWK